MGVVLFWVSLSSVGINTYLKVDKKGKVSELSEMMLFDKEFHCLIHFLTNFLLFRPCNNIKPIIQTAYLYLKAKHHPTLNTATQSTLHIWGGGGFKNVSIYPYILKHQA